MMMASSTMMPMTMIIAASAMLSRYAPKTGRRKIVPSSATGVFGSISTRCVQSLCPSSRTVSS